MRKFLVVVLIMMVLGGLFVFGTTVKYGGALRQGSPWGQLSLNLNPFLPAGQNLAVVHEIYEPLFYINALNSKLASLW